MNHHENTQHLESMSRWHWRTCNAPVRHSLVHSSALLHHLSFCTKGATSGPEPNHRANAHLQESQTCSVSMVGHQCSASAVWVESADTVDRCQAEAAADDEGVPLGACVERREGVTHCLHRRGSQGCALADVEVRKPIFHRIPPPALALHAAVCKGVHGPVCDVLAEVETQRTQVWTSVGKSNHALICYENTTTQVYSSEIRTP